MYLAIDYTSEKTQTMSLTHKAVLRNALHTVGCFFEELEVAQLRKSPTTINLDQCHRKPATTASEEYDFIQKSPIA